MKAVAGVLTFNAGDVEVFDVKLDSDRAAERIKGRVGFMPQGLGLNLYPELSVEENVDFFARLRLVPPEALAERKNRLLKMTRLARFADRPMKHLSGGMKQKLGLVCTLIHEPEFVVLDEPTTGVDPVSRREFWAILAQLLNERGMTALVSTAYMDEASRFDRLSLLYQGRSLAEGEPEALRSLAPGAAVAVRAEPQLEAAERLRKRFPEVTTRGGWLHAFTSETDLRAAALVVRSALEGLNVTEVEATEPDLEDVFVALLRREGLIQRRQVEAPVAAPREEKAEHADILARELTRDFGAFRAVDRVSFEVRHGEIFGLLGANGAGKTTVIKMLTGILPPSAGRGQVAGVDMRRPGLDIKRRIGYMSQAFSLYQDLTVGENIRLYAGIYGLSLRETARRTDWVLEMSGLRGHERDSTASLSLGLRQRLALGCALVHRPEVLFLDEPTSGVDPLGRRAFWDTLFHLARGEGVAILVTTHYMAEAEHCDRLALMHAGRIIADAPPEELKQEVEREAGRLLEISSDRPWRAAERLAGCGFPDAALFGRHVHVFSRNAQDLKRIPAVLSESGITTTRIAERPLSMEDVFVHRVTSLERSEPHPNGGPR
jgi:ABC-2 type transport system ATP-binding protein